MVTKILFYLSQEKPLWVELKITPPIEVLLHFHYFISLLASNTQKIEVFLLRISSGNVNASILTCQYPQIYNFTFRKEFLEAVSAFI